MKEVLAVPEQALGEVISVLRAGLQIANVSDDTRTALTLWCDEMEDYIGEEIED